METGNENDASLKERILFDCLNQNLLYCLCSKPLEISEQEMSIFAAFLLYI